MHFLYFLTFKEVFLFCNLHYHTASTAYLKKNTFSLMRSIKNINATQWTKKHQKIGNFIGKSIQFMILTPNPINIAYNKYLRQKYWKDQKSNTVAGWLFKSGWRMKKVQFQNHNHFWNVIEVVYTVMGITYQTDTEVTTVTVWYKLTV